MSATATASEARERTLAQRRADFAFRKIKAVKERGDWDTPKRAKYARLVRKLPAMVLHNGLGQALAFHLADAKNESKDPAGTLVLHLTEWFRTRGQPYADLDETRLDSLIGKLVGENSRSYLRAQQEALALVDWMKKFADAFLPKEDA